VVAATHFSPLARVDRASGTNIFDEYLILLPAPRCRRSVSCARRTSAGTRWNTVLLVSWPLAAPFSAKCAYFECLNLGVQSSVTLCHNCDTRPIAVNRFRSLSVLHGPTGNRQHGTTSAVA